MFTKKKVEELLEGMMGCIIEALFTQGDDMSAIAVYRAQYDILCEVYEKVKNLWQRNNGTH